MKKIIIPKYATTLNIDIGLSFSACHTNQWLKKDNNLYVIGVEALKSNIDKLIDGKQTTFHHRIKEHYLDTNFIKQNKCILLNYAIVNNSNQLQRFYKTQDPGQCSIYKPPTHRDIYNVDSIIEIASCKLEDILTSIVFTDKVQYISFLKIDVQGADLEVVKSGSEILKNKVVYITLEAETTYESGNNNSPNVINNYMKTIGFKKVNLKYTKDPTYINIKFNHLYPPEEHGIVCIQNN